LERKNPQKSIKIEFRCKFDIELRRKYRFNQLIVNQIIFLKNAFKNSNSDFLAQLVETAGKTAVAIKSILIKKEVFLK